MNTCRKTQPHNIHPNHVIHTLSNYVSKIAANYFASVLPRLDLDKGGRFELSV